MSQNSSISRPFAAPTQKFSLESVAPRLSQLWSLWRSRRALARLDAHALDDIGLGARDAQAEARKPVWDVPANWRN